MFGSAFKLPKHKNLACEMVSGVMSFAETAAMASSIFAQTKSERIFKTAQSSFGDKTKRLSLAWSLQKTASGMDVPCFLAAHNVLSKKLKMMSTSEG